MPFFSIIIPLFNKEKYISEALHSVLDQTFQDFEIIIIDDGSTDNSKLEVLKFKDTKIKLYSTINSGVSAARNLGVYKSTGMYCAFLDADDLWKEFHLCNIKSLINKFPNNKVFSSSSILQTKNRIKKLTYSINDIPEQNLDYFKSSLRTSILHPSSLVIKKDTFIESKGFNKKFTHAEDTEYWFRLGLKYPIGFSNTPSVIFRDVENSLSKQRFNSKSHCLFKAFENTETSNKHFYKVLDNNLISIALTCKTQGFKNEYLYLISRIKKRNNLNMLQLLLLKLPARILKNSQIFKEFLDKNGISFTIY